MKIKNGDARDAVDFMVNGDFKKYEDINTLEMFDKVINILFKGILGEAIGYSVNNVFGMLEVYFHEDLIYDGMNFKYAYFHKNSDLIFATAEADIEFGEYDDGIIIIEKKDVDILFDFTKRF